MGDVIKQSAKYIFWLFMMALIGWTASATLSVMARIKPNDPIMQYFALALFDGGALVWLAVLIYLARGIPQRAVSFIMMVIDLVGVAIMVYGDLWLSQTFTEVPTGLGTLVIWAVTIASIANAIAGMYIFHLLDPDTNAEITRQSQIDKVSKMAEKKYERMVDGIAEELAREQAKLDLDNFIVKMRNLNANVIDVKAKPVPEETAKESLSDKLKGLFGGGGGGDVPEKTFAVDTPNPTTPAKKPGAK